MRDLPLRIARANWQELDREALERHGGFYADTSLGGRLYLRVDGVVLEGQSIINDEVRAFCVGDDGSPVFLTTPRKPPHWLHQIDEAERERERARAIAERERRKFLAGQP